MSHCPPPILLENFGWLSDAPCASVRNGMRGPESIGRIFFIFCMKLTDNDTTKTHVSNFQKILYGTDLFSTKTQV